MRFWNPIEILGETLKENQLCYFPSLHAAQIQEPLVPSLTFMPCGLRQHSLDANNQHALPELILSHPLPLTAVKADAVLREMLELNAFLYPGHHSPKSQTAPSKILPVEEQSALSSFLAKKSQNEGTKPKSLKQDIACQKILLLAWQMEKDHFEILTAQEQFNTAHERLTKIYQPEGLNDSLLRNVWNQRSFHSPHQTSSPNSANWRRILYAIAKFAPEKTVYYINESQTAKELLEIFRKTGQTLHMGSVRSSLWTNGHYVFAEHLPLRSLLEHTQAMGTIPWLNKRFSFLLFFPNKET